MKMMSVLLAGIALLISAVPVQAFAGSAELTVGVPTDRCPVFYCDSETGEIIGIGADLLRMAAEDAGYTVSFCAIEEESLKEALDNPSYDLVLPFGSAVTSSSGKPALVSDNLFQTPFTLVTVSDPQLPPLNELRVGMLSSLAGAGETVRQLYPGIDITYYDTMDGSVKALRAGKVDALLHNSYVWSYTLQKPLYSDLSVQPSAMFSMDFRAGTRDTPAGQAIIEHLNTGIAALTDTQRQAVVLDYTTRRLYHYDVYDYLYEQWLFLLLIVLLFISFVFIAVFKLRMIRFEQEEKMQQMLDHDPLTGVLSLSGFRKRVESLLWSHPDTPYILSYSNIRNFKYINDSLGMESGNALLRFWAERSQETLTELDAIARIGADHFAVLRHLVENDDVQFNNDQMKVFDPVRNYFVNRGEELRVQISMGIYVLLPSDHTNSNIDQMLDYARVAEKRVRDSQKEGFAFYHTDQWETGKRIVDFISRLPVAIPSGEIQVWYQPQVQFETGKILGAEALCRWNHAQRGWISPSEFIPALEEAGLIYDLDCFVWEQVCKDLHRWNGMGKQMIASVNLSRADFAKDPDIADHFRQLIQTYKLSPKQLHIEITETAYVENPGLLITTTQKFREYGFQVEMDDFGSGYSSLNMLKEVQVDRIKLDLHFLTETGDPEKGRIIIRHMIQMAHSLGMGLIAEGVERQEQAQFLHDLGCTEMQGFYYYKPMPAQDYLQLFEDNT